MSETTNYKLHLTESGSEKFLDWRNEMNGATNSNMVKIDAALGQKADSSATIDAVLLASTWTGSSAPFTQEISVPGLSASQNGNIALAQSATVEQREAAREAALSLVGQEAEKLTIAADGERPSCDLPVTIMIYGYPLGSAQK